MAALTKKNTSSGPVFFLSGILDETMDLARLFATVPDSLTINCKSVSRIDSAGSRKWLLFFSQLRKQGVGLTFVECSPALVRQANLIMGMIGSAELKSIYIPLFCRACGNEVFLLRSTEELKLTHFDVPVGQCGVCEGTLVFDEIPEEYFTLLKG